MIKRGEWRSAIDSAAYTKLIGLAYKIHNSVESELDHKLDGKDLNRKQLSVLQILTDNECVYPSMIVKSTKITFPELSRMLEKLETKGYLSRQSYRNKDRRKLSLEIMPKGKKLVKTSRDILTSLPPSLISSLTEQEKEMLLNFLQTFPAES